MFGAGGASRVCERERIRERRGRRKGNDREEVKEMEIERLRKVLSDFVLGSIRQYLSIVFKPAFYGSGSR